MSRTFKTVSVIGLGYIGLPTAAILAREGVEVIGVDVNEKAVTTINRGDIHIFEPGLREVVRHTVAEKKFRAVRHPEPADAFVIAVPTPFKEDRTCDLSFIQAAANSIAPVLQSGNTIVLESTSPVGTTEQLEAWLQDARPDLKFPSKYGEQANVLIAYCPERVLPGKVMEELLHNDRIVGGLNETSSNAAADLYRIFLKGNCLRTNARTAEMAKLTENSYRDVNIAFANELSVICDRLEINVWELIRLANRHPRVEILQPGPGVGGHCVAVDPWFIVSSSPDEARLIRTAREVNDYKPEWVKKKIHAAIGKVATQQKCGVEDVTVACLGLAFKANIDDLRESPALAITKAIALSHRGKTIIVEPNLPEAENPVSGAERQSLEDALESAQVVVLLVDHDEFKAISRGDIEQVEWIDTRGILDR